MIIKAAGASAARLPGGARTPPPAAPGRGGNALPPKGHPEGLSTPRPPVPCCHPAAYLLLLPGSGPASAAGEGHPPPPTPQTPPRDRELPPPGAPAVADSPAGDETPLPRSDTDTSPASQHAPLNPKTNVEPGPVSAADSTEIETGSRGALRDGASAPSPPAFVPPRSVPPTRGAVVPAAGARCHPARGQA